MPGQLTQLQDVSQLHYRRVQDSLTSSESPEFSRWEIDGIS